MTTNEIRDKIAWLEDDILACQVAITLAETSAERWEYRNRISANRRELVRLKTTMEVINADPLF